MAEGLKFVCEFLSENSMQVFREVSQRVLNCQLAIKGVESGVAFGSVRNNVPIRINGNFLQRIIKQQEKRTEIKRTGNICGIPARKTSFNKAFISPSRNFFSIDIDSLYRYRYSLRNKTQNNLNLHSMNKVVLVNQSILCLVILILTQSPFYFVSSLVCVFAGPLCEMLAACLTLTESDS